MSIPFTHAQIEHLKLQVKITTRSSDILRAHALDKIANVRGFSYWALLMKHAGPNRAHPIIQCQSRSSEKIEYGQVYS